MYDIMKRLLTCILFAYILCTAALAKRVEGRVHYSSRVLPGVIVTDGEVFTRTDGEGYFRMEVRSDTRFIQVISPTASLLPLPMLTRNPGRRPKAVRGSTSSSCPPPLPQTSPCLR